MSTRTSSLLLLPLLTDASLSRLPSPELPAMFSLAEIEPSSEPSVWMMLAIRPSVRVMNTYQKTLTPPSEGVKSPRPTVDTEMMVK